MIFVVFGGGGLLILLLPLCVQAPSRILCLLIRRWRRMGGLSFCNPHILTLVPSSLFVHGDGSVDSDIA